MPSPFRDRAALCAPAGTRTTARRSHRRRSARARAIRRAAAGPELDAQSLPRADPGRSASELHVARDAANCPLRGAALAFAIPMWLAHALTLSRIPLAAVFWLTYGDRRWSIALVMLAALT